MFGHSGLAVQTILSEDMMSAVIRRNRRGSLLINSIILMVVLQLTGSSFLKWAVDESGQYDYDLAKTQAYYLARKGAISEGLTYLQNRKATDIREGCEEFEPTSYVSYPDEDNRLFYGKYEQSRLIAEMVDVGHGTSSKKIESGKYNLVFTATVRIPQDNGDDIVASSTSNVQIRRRSFANYLHLTDFETVAFPGQDPWDCNRGEIIRFWGRDTLDGRVHSNDWFAMMGRPVFRGPISTSKGEFDLQGGADPQFSYDPVFNAPEVVFSELAVNVRSASEASGTYISNNNGLLQSRITAGVGGFHLEQWAAGTIYTEDAVMIEFMVPYSQNRVVFVEGKLEIIGDRVAGKSTIASGGNMILLGDIVYDDFNWLDLTVDPDSGTILGLVSEANIIVANSVVNGQGNGNSIGGAGDHSNKHIVITAGMVALGVSFTFENQNDAPYDPGFDGYWWCDPDGAHPGEQDERGTIYLTGSLATKRRGYTHRSNCSGTGYDKQYRYDFRLQTDPPPMFIVAEDAMGNVVYDITGSWESDPEDENSIE
jgi:hypothetical protein